MTRFVRPKSFGRLLGIAAVFALSALASPHHFVHTASAQSGLSRFDEICLVMDREVSAGVALLILDPSAATARIDDAIERLRRARMNCERRWIDHARVDYAALRHAFPADERHVRTLSDISRSIAAVGTSSQP